MRRAETDGRKEGSRRKTFLFLRGKGKKCPSPGSSRVGFRVVAKWRFCRPSSGSCFGGVFRRHRSGASVGRPRSECTLGSNSFVWGIILARRLPCRRGDGKKKKKKNLREPSGLVPWSSPCTPRTASRPEHLRAILERRDELMRRDERHHRAGSVGEEAQAFFPRPGLGREEPHEREPLPVDRRGCRGGARRARGVIVARRVARASERCTSSASPRERSSSSASSSEESKKSSPDDCTVFSPSCRAPGAPRALAEEPPQAGGADGRRGAHGPGTGTTARPSSAHAAAGPRPGPRPRGSPRRRRAQARRRRGGDRSPSLRARRLCAW